MRKVIRILKNVASPKAQNIIEKIEKKLRIKKKKQNANFGAMNDRAGCLNQALALKR